MKIILSVVQGELFFTQTVFLSLTMMVLAIHGKLSLIHLLQTFSMTVLSQKWGRQHVTYSSGFGKLLLILYL